MTILEAIEANKTVKMRSPQGNEFEIDTILNYNFSRYDNFESASPLFISKADIFKLGEILGTVESLLTNASEE